MADDKTPQQRIYRQIEQAADFYGPAVYYRLTQDSARFLVEDDPAAADFIPVSQAAASGQNHKMFVIGILPPTANVTGNLLDRSASVPPVPPVSPTAAGPSNNPVGDGQPIPPDGLGSGADLANAKVDKNGFGSVRGKGGPLSDQWWIDYVAMCDRLGVEPEAMAFTLNQESGFNSSAMAIRQGKPVAKGLNQMMSDPAKGLGMSAEEYEHYDRLSPERQLYWAEKFFGSAGVKGKNTAQLYAKNFGGYASSNPVPGVLYASSAYQAKHPGTWPKAQFQNQAYTDNPGLDKDGDGAISMTDIETVVAKGPPAWVKQKIALAREAMKRGAKARPHPGSPFDKKEDGTSNWQKDGKAAASTAKETIDSTADTSISLREQTLSKLMDAQAAAIKQTQAKIDEMARMPPLRLIVNPSSFSVASEKIISDGNHGRYGPIVEHWGDGQDKIEGSGKIAAFYALDAAGGQGGPGLTRTARNVSESYRNFMSLYLLYKNNGTLWFDPTPEGGDQVEQTLSLVGSVYLYYDHTLYIGSFDSFSINESDDKPFTLDYSFSFTVRYTFILDNIDEVFMSGGKQINPLAQPAIPTTTAEPEGDEVTVPIATEFEDPADAPSPSPANPEPLPPSAGVPAEPSAAITVPKKGKGSK